MSTGMEIQLPNVSQHSAVLAKQEEQLDKWCTAGDVRAAGLIRYALAEMQTNDDLRRCTPTSIYLSLLACGVTGLVPGKLRGFSFLVPFGNTKKDGDREYKVQEATFMMGWKGVKHIGYRSNLHLVSAVIHENDVFDFDVGTQKFVKYKPALKGPGQVIGTAAWVELPRGGLEVEYLNLETLQKIKDAATRIRKSPAWEGPFKDQMQRKSALKRLGKQVEMGEEFLKADAIELAQDEHGHAAIALDELTDGAATKFLKQSSEEARIFGSAPRPAQVQVPAGAEPVHALGVQGPVGSKAAAPSKPKASERPTSGGGTTGAATAASNSSAAPSTGTTPASASSTPSKLDEAKAKVEAKAEGKAPGRPAQASASTNTSPGSSSPPPASPAATSSPSSASSMPSPSESSASGDPAPESQSQPETFGDVAAEPGPDEDFDTSFGDEDPVDTQVEARPPSTRAEWLAAFKAWAAAHPTKESVQKDSTWQPLMQGWANACQSKAEMDEDKGLFIDWGRANFAAGRRADPTRGVAAVPPDEGSVAMQQIFAHRYKVVP